MTESGEKATAQTSGIVKNPKLWGTGLYHKPNRYVAVTTIEQDGKIVDTYETIFGIRTLEFDADVGFQQCRGYLKRGGYLLVSGMFRKSNTEAFKETINIEKEYIQKAKIGDEVISSGLGRVYPKGLLIGKVVKVEEEKNKLYKLAEVQPAVDFSALEEVMVITGQ